MNPLEFCTMFQKYNSSSLEQKSFTKTLGCCFVSRAVIVQYSGARIPNAFKIQMVDGVQFSNGVRFSNCQPFFSLGRFI